MTEQEQIEEMARDLCECYNEDGTCSQDDSPCDFKCEYSTEALYLFGKGYRKQVEGEWVKHEHDFWGVYYTCSACKCDVARAKKYQLCPDCGAKMKGGAEQ